MNETSFFLPSKEIAEMVESGELGMRKFSRV